DDCGKGQVVAIAVTTGGKQEGVKDVVDITESIFKKADIPFTIHNIGVDACDSSLNEFQERGFSVSICRFHFIKDIQSNLKDKVSDTKVRSELLGLVYRMLISTHDDDYHDCLEALENTDKEGAFYKYFHEQWNKHRHLLTNAGRTSSMSFMNTTNYVESAIKSLQKQIKGTTQKKKSLHVCLLLSILAIRGQVLNVVPTDFNESEKEANQRLAKAREMVKLPIVVGDNNYVVPSESDDDNYLVVVGEQGFFCSCDDFLHTCGRPCKHIYRVILSLPVAQNYLGRSAVELLQGVCIFFNINIELNRTSTIPHFIPKDEPLLLPLAINNKFPRRKKCGRKHKPPIPITNPTTKYDHVHVDDNIEVVPLDENLQCSVDELILSKNELVGIVKNGEEILLHIKIPNRKNVIDLEIFKTKHQETQIRIFWAFIEESLNRCDASYVKKIKTAENETVTGVKLSKDKTK
ncbi:predicted protein, partial [Naegleria gruberi]